MVTLECLFLSMMFVSDYSKFQRILFFKLLQYSAPSLPPFLPSVSWLLYRALINCWGFFKILHHFSKTHTDLLLTYFSTGCDRCTVGGYHGNG